MAVGGTRTAAVENAFRSLGLDGGAARPVHHRIREGMRERGDVEGQNLAFILRYAPGEPAALRAMLPDLLSIPADLIVSSGPAILAMRATTEKPVLFAISGDPVELGIAEGLSRPSDHTAAAPPAITMNSRGLTSRLA